MSHAPRYERQGTPWLRVMTARNPEEEHRASTPLELLFDLCFVVAVAQLGGQLHHALAEGHVAAGLFGYVTVFFGIWWAWMNFTWFASAYDTDDVPYRLLTLLQIAGVLVLAAGVPAAFQGFDFSTMTYGYVLMRVAMVAQWLRVAAQYPAGRKGALRYAIGISLTQIGWVCRLFVPASVGKVAFLPLVLVELLLPIWAESNGQATTWHPEHINERYGLFTLIVLGEMVSACTVTVQAGITDHGFSLSLALTAGGALLLVFGLWWVYFKHDSVELLKVSFVSSLIWGYGHYLVFASVAALGAGLEVATETVSHMIKRSDSSAAMGVAIPVSIFLFVTIWIHARQDPRRWRVLGVLTVGLAVILEVANQADALTLPYAIDAIAVIVVGLLAASLAYFHRTSNAIAKIG